MYQLVRASEVGNVKPFLRLCLPQKSILLPLIIASNSAAAYLNGGRQWEPGLPLTALKMVYVRSPLNVQNPHALALLCAALLGITLIS